MERISFNTERMFTYVRGFANGANLTETQAALVFAREMHRDQKRKSGEPYIIHPLTMACNAISIGVRDDNVLAAILLHDVCEDCGVKPSALPISREVQHSIALLTFDILDGETKDTALVRYYNAILEDRTATIVKLFDRCHNVSSMAGTFSVEKLKAYISETRQFVLPLLRKAKDRYPNDSNVLFVLKYHTCSLIDSIEATMQVYEPIVSALSGSVVSDGKLEQYISEVERSGLTGCVTSG